MTTTTDRNPQRMHALDRANEIRLARAELKRRVNRGETTAAEVLIELPREAQSMTIYDLLVTQRRWGQRRAMKLLRVHQIAETKPLRALTDRQRQLLAGTLERQGRSRAVDPFAGEGES